MRALTLVSPGKFRWDEQPMPKIVADDDAVVRPFIASRCDGDQIPISAALLRVMRLGQKGGLLDPVLREAFGPRPYPEPCAIGHECVAEVVEVGPAITSVAVGDKVVVPYPVSCGQCDACRRGLTGRCATTRRDVLGQERVLSWYGHGHTHGPYGGMASDFLHVPYANHMLKRVPDGLDPFRIAAASDNLSEAWRCTAPHLQSRKGAKVMVVGGIGQAIGLYAAGIAVTCGAEVDYLDSCPRRLKIAESFGARARQRPSLFRFPKPSEFYDVVIDASSVATGITHAIRSTGTGGTCVVASYHLGAYTGIPMMHLVLNDINLVVGMNHPGTNLPDVLGWVHENDFPAEKVTTEVVDWEDAPKGYGKRTTKLILHRSPLG
ncbi:hypothetical protein BKG71_21980 [Mycobacteroides chelonae]|uniref:Alcohol dehydrogenase-like N-terminal domain-containing protein n=3 Tax=Mycobacteroides chelonae TaxID=1774 RepID=A0AB73M8X5_MYCCH|nr:alcohol dehydrogenase catalytic domain-containing protein [Mycobacteroides chelonae]MBF9420805.1 alcohol dehydrogenase catalytic domain-containing protein [Mycobacteroides chelonae]MBF9437004.1 alcohol dehydrogenase catalytic domain-containing protein [Mycobacteroides chelonae]MBV6360707.1 alcohol dehydrogenase catalytic domain-containing protein [Mycobacteroides chelonae]OHT48610.1 hypothetical protein BKG62_23080 [Mycobacteroides chelonae]